MRLAIVGPSFFSYIPAIVAEFRKRDIEAFAFDERHANSVGAKILYRLGAYAHRWGPRRPHLASILERIIEHGCTDVLLIDVEVVDRAFVKCIRDRGLRVHIYMWDGIANKPRFTTYLDLVDSSGSFDPVDCEATGMTYIPLFAEPIFDERGDESTPAYRYDISFCGTMHSTRCMIIARMLKSAWVKRRSLELMLYYHSRFLFLVKSVTRPGILILAHRITDIPFSKAKIAAVFRRSRFVLDISHPGQTGMTARTFEVLLSGARLLTFNGLAMHALPASLAPRIQIIASIDEAGAIDFDACERLPPLSSDERYFLSLSRFVDQLGEMMRGKHRTA